MSDPGFQVQVSMSSRSRARDLCFAASSCRGSRYQRQAGRTTLVLPIGPALFAPPTRENNQRTNRAFKENQQSYQQNDYLSIT